MPTYVCSLAEGFQNASSRLTLVLCLSRTIERLTTGDSRRLPICSRGVPAKRGEIEDGAKKAFLTSAARMGIGTGGKGNSGRV
jgi:hypothetical protein